MTLQQIAGVQGWHVRHHRRRSTECQVWEAVLTLWIAGCAGLPISAVLGDPVTAAVCVAAIAAPHLYRSLRGRLHRAYRLRCEWLCAGSPGR